MYKKFPNRETSTIDFFPVTDCSDAQSMVSYFPHHSAVVRNQMLMGFLVPEDLGNRCFEICGREVIRSERGWDIL